MPTNQTARPGMVRGETISRDITADHTRAAAIGVAKATNRIPAAANG